VPLILSEHSIKNDGVETEVTTAFEYERKRGQTVLFPKHLDDTVSATDEGMGSNTSRASHWRLSALERPRRLQEELRAGGPRSCAKPGDRD
jgi:hypothetical protein